MSNSKTWCPLPWIHLATRPNGDVRLCCTSNASGAGVVDSKSIGLVNNGNSNFNLKTHSIDEVWNSSYMKTVRLQMLAGEIPRSCQKCFEEEANGINSKRKWETEVWQSRIDIDKIVNQTSADGSLPVNIPYFDLRLGNTCQLKCIMCSPHDSSSWISDWKIQHSKYTLSELQVDQNWNTNWDYNWYQNSEFLYSMKSQAEHIRELYFAGGEPLLIPEHYKILEFMIDSGASKHCTLRYNSNGLVLPDQLFTLWNQFKEVKFNFSIDSVREYNDYIRYPSKWLDVETNLRKLDDTPNNVTVNIACAVQILNVMHLPELVQWKLDSNFKKINKFPYGAGLIGMHLVYLPSYLNVKVLPVDIKHQVSDKLNTFINSQSSDEFNSSIYGKQRWQGLLKYMHSEDWSHKLPNTIQFLETTDITRGTNFRNLFNHLSDLK